MADYTASHVVGYVIVSDELMADYEVSNGTTSLPDMRAPDVRHPLSTV